GEPGERLAETPVELRFEERDEDAADAIAREAHIGVRTVDGEWKAALREEAADVGAGHVEERTEQSAADGSHAAEPPTPRPAKQTGEDGLDLVGARVSGHDAGGADGGGGGGGGAVAGAPPPHLDPRARRDRDAAEDEAGSEPLRQGPDLPGFDGSFRGPEAVVDVSCGEPERACGGELG